jgi:SAM-dependent methyltransferase
VDLTAYYDDYWSGKDDAFDASRLGLLTRRVPKGARFLEVGCGPGLLGRLLREREVHVTGLDHSHVALVRARDKGVACVRCAVEGEPLPVRDEAFEWAASNSSLEHLFDPTSVIEEIHRVLKPGGVFLWMVPNVGHWRFRLWLAMGRFPVVENSPTDPLHLRMYTRHDAVVVLKRIGFRVRRVTGSAGTWVPVLYPAWLRLPGVRHLYETLAPAWPSMLCRYLVVEAEKVGKR